MNRRIRYYISILGVVSALVVSLIGGSSNVAHAITYGEPDGDEHPYVGIVALYDDSYAFIGRASGTLISPTVVLTAGHVTFEATYVRVSFESDLSSIIYPGYDDPAWVALSYTGTPFTHPEYDPNWGILDNSNDVGVILLDTQVVMDEYGELPELGILDTLATKRGLQERIFTTVGYGLQSIRPFYQGDIVRYKATSMLVNLESALTDGYNLHTSNNPGKGQGTGGSALGDSGGPVFLDDTRLIVAVVSFGLNKNAKGADFGYRIDISNSQDFILSFPD